LIAILFSFLAGFNFPRAMINFFEIISIYNFSWAFFNLLPFPPLDGFHILYQILPDRFSSIKLFLLRYGFLILLFIIFFGLAPIFSFSQILFNLISH
jgi:Zn-dependent protease